MTVSPKNNPLISIIILNYNSQDYLAKCFVSLKKSLNNINYQLIIVDNNSGDNSISLAKKNELKNTQYILLKDNHGFAKGNNFGLKKIDHPKYVLFLNPDTILQKNTIKKMLNFFEKRPQVSAATCDVILAKTGKTQLESHRGFPNPWNTFWHFFGFGLPRLFPKSKIFNGYFLGHLDYSKIQQIDCCVGAFLMIKKEVGDTIGWWNEKYYFYGEDLDFCYKLKQHNFKLFFYPYTKIIHYQGISSGILSHTQKKSTNTRLNRIRIVHATTQAMRIFYQENLMNNHPKILHPIINLGISFLEIYRIFKAKYL